MSARIIVCGALGRMGRQVINAVLSQPERCSLVGVLEHPQNPLIGQEVGPIIGRAEVKLPLVTDFSQVEGGADVYIDFTSIESSLAYLAKAHELGLGAVIGTTGFSAEQQAEIKKAAESIPVLWAPNMSIGINALYKIATNLVKMLGPDYDLEVVEAHHKLKKDAPSGTAVRIYETLAEARQGWTESRLVSGREGLVGERTKEEIGVLALRGGDIVGDHTVYFCGPGERLELTHRAHTRDTFAQGSVRAGIWLAGRAPGFYAIDDTMSF